MWVRRRKRSFENSFTICSWAGAVDSKGCVRIVVAAEQLVTPSAWAIEGSMGAVGGAVWTIEASEWDTRALCGILHPPRDLFQVL